MINMDEQILQRIAQAEQEYQQHPHTGTRCELLKAYDEAAVYAQKNGASAGDVYTWREKAFTLADIGAEKEPCFVSYWDAAISCANAAAAAQACSDKRLSRALLKCAAAYLERILDEKMESPVEGCDAASVLQKINATLAELV